MTSDSCGLRTKLTYHAGLDMARSRLVELWGRFEVHDRTVDGPGDSCAGVIRVEQSTPITASPASLWVAPVLAGLPSTATLNRCQSRRGQLSFSVWRWRKRDAS